MIRMSNKITLSIGQYYAVACRGEYLLFVGKDDLDATFTVRDDGSLVDDCGDTDYPKLTQADCDLLVVQIGE